MTSLEEYTSSLTSSLVRINSENPPGRETEIASYVSERLAELGLKAWVDRFDERANAIGVYEAGEGHSLMLMTHLDTVPAGERDLWRIPPFSGEIRDGRVYGRGSADAKGCLASMLGALKLLADEGWPIKGKLILAAVADEEAKNRGVRRLLAQKISAEYAVVGEPTSLQVCSAHKGILLLRVRFIGKSAHSSQPRKGINAAYAASDFALRVEKLGERLKVRHRLLGRPSIALTILRGGIKENIIPDSCELVLDRRTLPNEKLERIIKELRRLTERVAKARKVKAEVGIVRYLPAAETSTKSRIVVAAVKACSKILGERVRPRGFRATCDMCFLVHGAKIPSVILGPGSLLQAHTIDEWVSIDELVKAAKIYREIVAEILR